MKLPNKLFMTKKLIPGYNVNRNELQIQSSFFKKRDCEFFKIVDFKIPTEDCF